MKLKEKKKKKIKERKEIERIIEELTKIEVYKS